SFSNYFVFFFFFFQAEDGIRDRTVTGVQTCALPIFEGKEIELVEDGAVELDLFSFDPKLHLFAELTRDVADESREAVEHLPDGRSEERRVGKEGRWGRGGEG